MSSKVDYLVEKQYSSAQYVHEKGPKYIYGGRDPIHGIDCSGLAMFMLGKMGYFGQYEDMNSTFLYSKLYTRNRADPELGRRGDELKAYFVWNETPDPNVIVHVAMPAAPHLIVHATSEPSGILAWYGAKEAEIQAEAMLSTISDDFWDSTGAPIAQKLLYKLFKDSILFADQYFSADLATDIVNWLSAFTDYEGYEGAHPTPNEAYALVRDLQARKLGRDGFVPDSISLSGDHYEYDVSELQDSMGRAGIKEEIVCKLLGFTKESVVTGSCVSITSDSKFIGYFNERSGATYDFSVETRYMDHDRLGDFRVSDPNVHQFGPGSLEHG